MTTLTAQQLALLVERAEFAAWANYYSCAPLEFAAQYGVSVQRVGSGVATMMQGVNSWFFNRINGLGLEEAATQTMLDQAIGILKAAGCNEFTVQLSSLAQPSELVDWLKIRGLRVQSNWAKMIRENEPVPVVSTRLRVEQIGASAAEPFGRIALENFEMPSILLPMMSCHLDKPGWLNYLGFDGEQPVATASMFIAGHVAWLGMGSTLVSHRGRGAQSAMFARRIQDGLEAGCKWFVTETGEDTPASPNPSYRNMLRAGFRLVYLRPNYVGLLDERPAIND